jgi:hypothetical protein
MRHGGDCSPTNVIGARISARVAERIQTVDDQGVGGPVHDEGRRSIRPRSELRSSMRALAASPAVDLRAIIANNWIRSLRNGWKINRTNSFYIRKSPIPTPPLPCHPLPPLIEGQPVRPFHNVARRKTPRPTFRKKSHFFSA